MEIIWENESQWQFFFAITIHFCDSAKRDGTAAVFLKSRQRMQRIDSEFLSAFNNPNAFCEIQFKNDFYLHNNEGQI